MNKEDILQEFEGMKKRNIKFYNRLMFLIESDDDLFEFYNDYWTKTPNKMIAISAYKDYKIKKHNITLDSFLSHYISDRVGALQRLFQEPLDGVLFKLLDMHLNNGEDVITLFKIHKLNPSKRLVRIVTMRSITDVYNLEREKLDKPSIEKEQYLSDTDELSFQILTDSSKANDNFEIPLEKPNKNYTLSYSGWPRNPNISKRAILNAEFKCEIDANHKTFLSEVSGENYMEAHHIIPMSFQDKFDNRLDVPSNIISLCPNCHRKVHFSKHDIKIELLNYIYEKRQLSLEKYGIKVSLQDLYKMYMGEGLDA